MSPKQRYYILKQINYLLQKYEDEDLIDVYDSYIEYDFFDDLYEIVYHFDYDPQKLSKRLLLLFQKWEINKNF